MAYVTFTTRILSRALLCSSTISLALAPLPSTGMSGAAFEATVPGLSYFAGLGGADADLSSNGRNNYFYLSPDNKKPDTTQEKSGVKQTTNFVPWLLVGGLVLGAALASGKGGGKGAGSSSVQPGMMPAPNSFETPEYQRDYSLGMINASARYTDGGTGSGQILSVFDSGIDDSHVDLKSKVIYRRSYLNNNDDVTDYDSHGTHVASKLAGVRNGHGVHGVAFDAKLAVFHAISSDPNAPVRGGLRGALADAQRESINLGAVAINHSWGFVTAFDYTPVITDFKTRSQLRADLGEDVISALRESTDAGLITVFAAGNESRSEVAQAAGIPVYFPEFGNHILAVVAVDSNRKISDFSNYCGIAKNYCLAAPGEQIFGAVSHDSGFPQDDYRYANGTSMAAPHVTGAVAVLADNFPELTGAEITTILRETATDLGAPGVDRVYGHGLLNLKNAVAPQGKISIATGNSIDSPSVDLDDSRIAGNTATARALRASLAGTRFMVSDRYKRGYSMDFNDVIETEAGFSSSGMDGLRHFTAAAALPPQHRAESPVTISAGDFSAGDGVTWPDAKAFGSVYGTFIDTHHLGFTHDTGQASIRIDTAIDGDEGAYTATELTARISGGHSLSVQAGHLRESGAVLGTSVTGAFGVNLHSDTKFARFGGSLRLNDSTSLAVSVATGNTSFASQGILAEGNNIKSSAIALGVKKTGLFKGGDSFSVGLSRPLSVDAGRMVVDTPVSMGVAVNGTRSLAIHRKREEADVQPSDHMADLQVGYTVPAAGGGVAVGGVWRTGDQSGDKFALSASYGIRF